ncbi:MAG: TIGR00730 family Rossman fold protein [Chitinophagaceae bacterium]|nr:TIGR00730 family Rossman fold protein [Chitinophagaceae bacterium]
MNNITSIAVFCGSKSGNNPSFIQQTELIGQFLGVKKITLVYGGGKIGLMGCIANAVLQENGKVIGVIPKVLVEWEQQHDGITELLVVENMHVRKKMMYEKSDAAIILPGGNGTLDELFEMLTWNTLKIHEKKVFILNIDGFYDALILHFKKMQDENFLYENWQERIIVCNNAGEFISYFSNNH